MKAYVINLDKNTERMAAIDAQLKRLGILYERIPAVYGKALSKAERRKQFASFRSYCATGYRLYDGEIGCALSHVAIYKKMMAEAIELALILEDDVVVEEGLLDRVNEVSAFAITDKPQVFLLSAHGAKNTGQIGIEKINGGSCTDGYIITLAAAKIVCNANFPVVTVSDSWRRWGRRYGLEMYRVWPTTVRQDNVRFGTDINPYMFARSIRWVKVEQKITLWIKRPLRVIGWVVDWLYFWRYGK